MYELGIVGGMGPLATAEFLRRIINFTEVGCDQEHIIICVHNKTCVPDRMDYILNKNGDSQLPFINDSFNELSKLGVKVVAMPCNTSKFFVDLFEIPDNVFFIDMVLDTIITIRDHFLEKIICVLVTTGAKLIGVYGAYAKLLADNFQLIYPEQKLQKLIMDIIYMVKAGQDDDEIILKLPRLLEEI